MTYCHTQKAPLCLLVYVWAIPFLAVAWVAREDPVAAIVMTIAALVMVVLGASFQHLTISDEGHRLLIRFGPLPLFRKRIWYDDIQSVERGRTMILEGWGINLSPRGGWVWNIWGRDCVVLRVRRRVIRVGTDDAENLARFLKDRISDVGS